jgi:DNA-binding LacI/PurR family transcriptional regulator
MIEDLEDMPSVFIGELPENSDVAQVCMDNRGGGRKVGEYLWSLGHRSVGMVFPLTDGLVAMRRLQGLSSAWEEYGESIPDSHLLRVDTGSEFLIREVIEAFLAKNCRSPRPVTALFCFNDWTACTVIKALRRQQVRVPEDMSVVGFDDENYSSLIDPPLTTVHQPFNFLGIKAAELLLSLVESPGQSPRQEVAPSEVVVRDSTAPPCALPNFK